MMGLMLNYIMCMAVGMFESGDYTGLYQELVRVLQACDVPASPVLDGLA